MKPVRMLALSAALLLAEVAGCGGGPKYAPVSGVVTLNGKPYSKAVVVFQPIATPDNPEPGRGSSGFTDENGRFTLKTDEGQQGAVVGKHLVRIMTKWNSPAGAFESETGSPDGDPKLRIKVQVDPIPPEWNSSSTKEFVVPPGGTDSANFDIISRRR
ncbi:MAG TPA: hypothetical protein VNK04_25910 [Gemmataceae bacterium]|nr:hypothetical protein [Gemmataceae bacterium]